MMLGKLIASFQRRVRESGSAFGRCCMAQDLCHTTAVGRLLPEKRLKKRPSSLFRFSAWTGAALLYLSAFNAYGVDPGTVISNTAQLDYSVAGSPRSLLSNTATTTTVAVRTQATITVSRYWPSSPDAVDETVPDTFYEDAGGNLQPIGDVFAVGSSTPLDLSSPVALADSTSLIGGDPMFVQVEDGDQNQDSTVAETIRVVITSETGDSEILILTETGPDSGIFIGVVQTTKTASGSGDGVLYVVGDSQITASYTDPVDGSDAVDASLLVDPLGVIFASCDGTPVDGTEVTLINADTNSPATVFGDDGVSSYPSTLISGSGATDGSGAVYNFAAGAYRFPLVGPGNYRLEIVPPTHYSFPSVVPDATLQGLPGAPFALNAGSRGNVFAINPGPAVEIDVPVDCSGEGLLVTKTSGRTVVGIGDFLPYEVSVSNGGDTNITAAVVNDVLPPGFRYAKGSARVNDSVIADPQIGSAGSRLTFALGDLPAGETLTLNYVVEVTAGAAVGDAVNSASATDGLGATSNVATARVRVRDDFFRNKTFITGRIFDESNAEQSCSAADDKAAIGLENARVYLEDGTVILSDESGRFHFEGLEPGTHVVQLDAESLPANYEIVQCDDDTRSAGRAFSRFVDIQGGGMWRTDFYVREGKPEPDHIKQSLSAEPAGKDWSLSLTLSGEFLPISNIRPMVILPEGLSYVPGSARLDGAEADEPEARGSVLLFNIGKGEG